MGLGRLLVLMFRGAGQLKLKRGMIWIWITGVQREGERYLDCMNTKKGMIFEKKNYSAKIIFGFKGGFVTFGVNYISR